MRRAAAALLGLAAVVAALVLVLGRKAPVTTPAPARPEARESLASTERPRRAPRAKPRPPARETREASVVAQPEPAPQPAPPAAAPAGAQSPSPRARDLATTVLQAAVRHDWMVIDEHDTPCPPDRIRVVYDAPSDLGGYQRGAYFEPLGPSPGDSDVEVNGLLLCEGSTFLYRGFEAYFRADRGQWEVFPFPVIE